MAFQNLVGNVLSSNKAKIHPVVATYPSSDSEVNVSNSGGFFPDSFLGYLSGTNNIQESWKNRGFGAALIASPVGDCLFSINANIMVPCETPPYVVAFSHQPANSSSVEFAFSFSLWDSVDPYTISVPLDADVSFSDKIACININSTVVLNSTPVVNSTHGGKPVFVGFALVWADGYTPADITKKSMGGFVSINQYLEQPSFFQPLK